MAQLAQRGRVEGRRGDAPVAEVRESPGHLPGRLVRERDDQHVARSDDLGRERVRDAPGDDPGLAAPGAGQDAQRPRGDRDGLALGRIEVGQEVVGVADWHPAIVAGCPSRSVTATDQVARPARREPRG